MIVRVPRGQLAYFRRKCLSKYPNEIMAVLAGKNTSKSEVEVHQFFYPKLEVSTPLEVKPYAQELADIESSIADLGLKWVGTIHSHIHAPPILSKADHQCHISDGDRISGVVEIYDKGESRCTFVAFWRHDSSLCCELKYF